MADTPEYTPVEDFPQDENNKVRYTKLSGKKLENFLSKRVKELKKCVDADEHNRTKAIEVLRFRNGDQWDGAEKQRREAAFRPCLQVNLLNKFIKQVVGEQRQNRPRAKVHAVDNQASVEIAKIREGIIRQIEYLSNAEAIYDYACEMQVTCGYGAWRIATREDDENPFIQEIYMEVIKNPFLVFLDPDAKDWQYADANYGFILNKIDREEFTDLYPDAEVPGNDLKYGKGLNMEHWYDDDTVTVADYFKVEKTKKSLCLMGDGRVLLEKKAKEVIDHWEKAEEISRMADPMYQTPADAPKILKTKKSEVSEIYWYKMTCLELLEEHKRIPGKFIPIIMVKGEEVNIEGKPFVRGLIHDAIDSQKLVNYWNSAAAEIIALAPKAPWLLTSEQIQGHEEAFAKANVENYPVLLYNHIEGQPQPTRTSPGDPPVAIFAQIQRAQDNMKDSIGMFIDLGETGREVTGSAVRARQKPGDLGSFAFIDNLSRAIAHSARVVNEMIPEIYDTERDIRIRNFNETESVVPINTNVKRAVDKISKNPQHYAGMNLDKLKDEGFNEGWSAKFNDLNSGKYDVVVSVGPSYTTQREESAEALLRIVQANPKAMDLFGDLIFEKLDILDNEEVSKRFRKMLPAGMIEPKEGEEPPQPLPPSPQSLLMQGKVQNEQLKSKIHEKDIELKGLQIIKEMSEDKLGMRRMVLELMQEILGENHPADALLHNQPAGSNPNQLGGKPLTTPTKTSQ